MGSCMCTAQRATRDSLKLPSVVSILQGNTTHSMSATVAVGDARWGSLDHRVSIGWVDSRRSFEVSSCRTHALKKRQLGRTCV
jgi:hypothetical protein